MTKVCIVIVIVPIHLDTRKSIELTPKISDDLVSPGWYRFFIVVIDLWLDQYVCQFLRL